MGSPTKTDHFGVFWGYPYFWKHPCTIDISFGQFNSNFTSQKIPHFDVDLFNPRDVYESSDPPGKLGFTVFAT